MPGVERDRRPAGEVGIAQDPCSAVGPRQNPEGRRIGDDDQIGEPGELRDSEAATGGECRREDRVGGVEAVDRAGEVDAVVQRGPERVFVRGTPC